MTQPPTPPGQPGPHQPYGQQPYGQQGTNPYGGHPGGPGGTPPTKGGVPAWAWIAGAVALVLALVCCGGIGLVALGDDDDETTTACLLYTSPSPRD